MFSQVIICLQKQFFELFTASNLMELMLGHNKVEEKNKEDILAGAGFELTPRRKKNMLIAV